MKYYVYQVKLEDEVIYVGKGQGERYKHATSGKSHNFKLNRYYFEHEILGAPLPVVSIIANFEEEAEALKYEKFLITDYLPECNIRCKTEVKPVTSEGVFHSPERVECTEEKDDDILINEIPEDYEDFKEYMTCIFDQYLENSTASSPHNLKWFLYSKLSLKKYENSLNNLNSFITEIQDSEVLDSGGRPKKFQSGLNMTPSEKGKFYRRFVKGKESQLDVNKDEDWALVESWLSFIRKGGRCKYFT